MRGEGSVYLRGDVWWLCYTRAGRKFRESARTTSRTEAERLLVDRRASIRAVSDGLIDEEILKSAIFAVESPARTEGLVYMLKPKGLGFVKIGTTIEWRTLVARIATLESGWPVDLEIVTLFRGCRIVEGDLHRCFRKYRIKREWFHFTPTIRAFVERTSEMNYFALQGSQLWTQTQLNQ